MTPADLHSWRYARKLSQKRLAELLGCTPATVCNWEKGHTRLPPWLELAMAGLDARSVELNFDRVNFPQRSRP